MQQGAQAYGEAMSAGTPPPHPPVFSGDAAAAHYFYHQYGPGSGMPRSMMTAVGPPPMMAVTAKKILRWLWSTATAGFPPCRVMRLPLASIVLRLVSGSFSSVIIALLFRHVMRELLPSRYTFFLLRW